MSKSLLFILLILGAFSGALLTLAIVSPTESTSCPVEPTGKLQTLEEVWYYWELSTNEFVGAAPKVWMSEHGVSSSQGMDVRARCNNRQDRS